MKGSPWPWIIGGGAALVALYLWNRSRQAAPLAPGVPYSAPGGLGQPGAPVPPPSPWGVVDTALGGFFDLIKGAQAGNGSAGGYGAPVTIDYGTSQEMPAAAGDPISDMLGLA